jgi:hypothetical protein
MNFTHLEHYGKWIAHGKEDRVWTITVTPSGYFKAIGDNAVQICRTHFEAVQWCENKEHQCIEDEQSSTIWEKANA